MSEEIIKIFEVNTDAIATNRGFYYQYLLVLKKWIKNFIDEKDIVTLIEVEDDIKEVGDEIIFTQVKCYTSSFSLNSKEIRKSIFNFFILYFKYLDLKEKLSFCFSTNSQISKKEKLLLQWVQNPELEDYKLLDLCIKKVKEILIKEIKERRIKLLQKGLSEVEKASVNRISDDFKNRIDKNIIGSFVKSIFWEFNELSPEEGVELLTKEIHTLLEHTKFNGKSSSLLFRVLTSEIYRSSQKEKKSERVLNNGHLTTIIKQTEDDLLQLIDNKLTKLFKVELESLKVDVANLIKTADLHSKDIGFLKNELRNTSVKIPKHLNLLPDFSSIDIYGWDGFLKQIHSALDKKKTISIYSEGGMGKTTFGKKYLQTFDEYDHIVWISVEKSISTSLLLDDTLRNNLKFTASTEPESIDFAFRNLLNTLNKIHGKNLIVIDIQESKNELSEIKSLSLSPNWHKLILTRSHLKTIPNERLPKIDFNIAKEIYSSHCKKEKIKAKF
ncbi:NB-ARC domain-containing protein [Aquimarina sp. 2201CG1-2-11]|uniref:dsDNA nuclease domain-containing protein n=1 Tax=Aquimarina discodermiae TaxID=3231043 RepID=UPI0034627B04